MPEVKKDRHAGFVLETYNRYGDRVFYTESRFLGWDGSMLGKPNLVQTGLYKVSISLTDVQGTTHAYSYQVVLAK